MTRSKIPQLLVMGPLPPPIAGTSVSFQIFCEEIEKRPGRIDMEVINSAPKQLGQKRLFTTDHLATACRITWQFFRRIRRADQVLIFANDQFLLSLAPICLAIARLAGKPCYIRIFGGSLDRYYSRLPRALRWFFRGLMRLADGLIVQTELLFDHFTSLLGDKVHLVPGYRYLPPHENGSQHLVTKNGKDLRLLYLGHVREEKGVFVLLESLRLLSAGEQKSIHCDLFGPIYPEVSGRLHHELSRMDNATYKGVLDHDEVIDTLRQYDAVIFPSYYQGEGHPGVLIEAMMAGVPMITTEFRSIPEVVQDRVNGLLVSPRNPHQLVDAIRLVHEDRQLLGAMAIRNWEMRKQYAATQLVPRILQPMDVTI